MIHWVLSRQKVPIDRLSVEGYYKQGMDTNTPKAGDVIFFSGKGEFKSRDRRDLSGGISSLILDTERRQFR
ncbi:hypothetical protein KEH51_26190 [[Brevibacterium] frigoritolerans]|uniref:Uncharacterized protein n=1 Tax=Peribacillus frigoritolerans TaxID=450367 RepID=A0A941J6H7_9BACI|nr:hypothetical protein [Peribacillus frigoritolerans]